MADRRLKVLLLTHNLAGIGGSFMRSYSLARALAGRGHEPWLLAGRSNPGIGVQTRSEDGLTIVEMPDLAPTRVRNGGLSPIEVLTRSAWVSRRRFDIVHAFDHRPAVSLPALVGRSRGAVLITDWADLWGAGGIAETRRGAERLIGLFDAWWERRFRTWADGATVITSRLGPALEASGIPEHRRMLLPPGANTDLVRPLDRDAARRGLGLPVEAAIVASTGFAPYDEDLLAEVILQVLRGEPSAMVVTSGRPPPALRARLAQHGMDSRARHLGTVPFSEFERVLACADVLLLPYGDREVNRGRFPNRFGDYLASGRAIVTNPTGDLGELAAAHQIAILAPEAPQAFAAEVLRLLRDPVRRDELGRRARAFAEEELSWPILAERVERFYRECLGSGRRLASGE